jgi:hypothetical protein
MESKELSLEKMSMTITEEIFVKASPEATFAAVLRQLGPLNELQEGAPLPMKFEAWPGGRWFRDLGEDNGHCWGHVQAIKRPTLIEIYGPLMMSYPATSNIQYRLSAVEGGTLVKFHHKAFGWMQEDHKEGFQKIWGHKLPLLKSQAEGRST